MKEYIITENEVGIRLDKAISMLDTDLSRVAIQRMIEKRKYISKPKES